MALTWKDGLTALLAGGVGLLAYAKYQSWAGWLTAPRIGIIVLAILGVAMCTLGTADPAHPTPWTSVLSVLGGASIILIIAGLITGHSLVFYALAADILALWLLSTLRHLVEA